MKTLTLFGDKHTFRCSACSREYNPPFTSSEVNGICSSSDCPSRNAVYLLEIGGSNRPMNDLSCWFDGNPNVNFTVYADQSHPDCDTENHDNCLWVDALENGSANDPRQLNQFNMERINGKFLLKIKSDVTPGNTFHKLMTEQEVRALITVLGKALDRWA